MLVSSNTICIQMIVIYGEIWMILGNHVEDERWRQMYRGQDNARRHDPQTGWVPILISGVSDYALDAWNAST